MSLPVAMIGAAGVRGDRLQSQPGDAMRVPGHEIPCRVCIVELADDLRITTRPVGAADFAVERPAAIVALDYDDGPPRAARPLG